MTHSQAGSDEAKGAMMLTSSMASHRSEIFFREQLTANNHSINSPSVGDAP
jgi:hypothetical protein